MDGGPECENPLEETVGVWGLDWLVWIWKARARGGEGGRRPRQGDSGTLSVVQNRHVWHINAGQMLKYQVHRSWKTG